VTVKVTDMRGVDLERYRFNFDLTFSMLLMHPDGHVYHRYGGRDVRGANQWLSAESLESVLETTLEEHAAYRPTAEPAPPTPPLRLEEVPIFAKRDKGECIHCHSVFESVYQQRMSEDRLRLEDLWVFPAPARLGLDLDRDEQQRITAVSKDSPAARAGLAVDDRLLRVGETPIATASDVMFALDRTPAEGGELAVQYRRGDAEASTTLELAADWRTETPREYSWRALKWGLDPVPGFGGPVLSDADREAAGLGDRPFAFRINYFVTWGPRAFSGAKARKAGLREGDLVYEVGGERSFESIDHFHAWWRLTRTPGEAVTIRFLRDGQRREVSLIAGR